MFNFTQVIRNEKLNPGKPSTRTLKDIADRGASVHPKVVTSLPRNFQAQVGSCRGEPEKLRHSEYWIVLRPYKFRLPPEPFPRQFSAPDSPGYCSLHTKASSLRQLSTDDKAKLAKHLDCQCQVEVTINDIGPVKVKAATALRSVFTYSLIADLISLIGLRRTHLYNLT